MRTRTLSAGIALAVAATVYAPLPAAAKTFVIPHFVEVRGTALLSELTQANLVPDGFDLTKGKGKKADLALDTTLLLTYVGGHPGAPVSGGTTPGATVDLYLYDQASGEPLTSATGVIVCNPCTYTLGGPVARKRSVVLDTEITAHGGFPSAVVQGYAVLVVTGDADNVSIASLTTHATPRSGTLAVAINGVAHAGL